MIILGGPTASGKSKIGIELAKNLNGEIISADSMQIYKGLDIGTAKITQSEMQGIPHYGIDIVEPTKSFSVAEFKNYAEEKICDIEKRRKLPIIVGGTGLYLRSICYPYSFGSTGANIEFRNKMQTIIATHGKDYLYKELVEKNPKKASTIHPNNIPRVIRALEIEYFGNENNGMQNIKRDNCCYFVLRPKREMLYKNINTRVDTMIENGLEQEVRTLLKENVTFDCQSMKGIGYKEWENYFNGTYDLDGVVDEIKKNSRNYAKRQETWFKKEDAINIELDEFKNIDKIVEYIANNYEI